MSKDPIVAALEAAVQPLVNKALADAKRTIIAAIDKAFAGIGSTETIIKPAAVKRETPKPRPATKPAAKRRVRNAGLVGFMSKSDEERAGIDAAILAGGTDAEVSKRFGVYHGSVGFRRKTLQRRAVDTPISVAPVAAPVAPIAVETVPLAPVQAVTEAA